MLPYPQYARKNAPSEAAAITDLVLGNHKEISDVMEQVRSRIANVNIIYDSWYRWSGSTTLALDPKKGVPFGHF